MLADLGFDDAEELPAKAALAFKLNELIEQRGPSQTKTAVITGMTQPKVSQVRRYKLQNISLERLMRALVSLDQHVEIVVQSNRRTHVKGITVVAWGRLFKFLSPLPSRGRERQDARRVTHSIGCNRAKIQTTGNP